MPSSKTKNQNQQPGQEYMMDPQPIYDRNDYYGSQKLLDKVIIITGGDSGIGRSISVLAAKEGADIVCVFLNESIDAHETKSAVEHFQRQCLLIPADLRHKSECERVVQLALDHFSKINVLINNAAMQFPQTEIAQISENQLIDTFCTNFFSYFFMTQATLPYLQKGDSIINTTSVTAYRGSEHLLDYASTKGAIVSFTRSLALQLVSQDIRVNAVAPGPVWTPLIPASFPESKVQTFGEQVPMQRAGHPIEVAHSYIFLASKDSSYITGQVLHPNGGEIINT
jgi:NAD(P)-dependent dehydrogenase (short-subunit alcohol dehydrogenase family)